jgi:hypothetical protein
VLPNLFVIGGVKCGTTSLHAYLAEHPQIFMSAKKELHFFWKDDWRKRLDWYEQQFPVDAPVRGESTPHYSLYPEKRHVAERIHSVAPDARFIYLVRDPLERIVSHWVERYSHGEWDRPLADYVRDCDVPENQVICGSRYYTQVEQYMQYFPRDRLLVVDQHDLKADRRGTLQEVFRFLGVDESFESPTFDMERNTRSEKRVLNRVTKPLWDHVLGPPVRHLPEPTRERVRRRILLTLTRPIRERPELTPAQRDRLVRVLQPEVDGLRRFTGKEFATWCL